VTTISGNYKFFSKLFWKICYKMIWKSKIVGLVVTWIFTILLFLYAHSLDDTSILWSITAGAWKSVTGSILAATIYALITWIIEMIQSAKETLTNEYHTNIAINQGVRTIFSQKGSEEALDVYETNLKQAKNKIWAFGMTNSNLVYQHLDIFIGLISKQNIDIVIVFWSPYSKLLTPKHSTKERPIISVQEMIESESPNLSTNVKHVVDRQKSIIDRVSKISNKKGRLRIINISVVNNFSTFVIDDHVFFFPFLHGPHSNNEPIIYCDADKGMGKKIVLHCSMLLDSKISSEVCELIYDTKDS